MTGNSRCQLGIADLEREYNHLPAAYSTPNCFETGMFHSLLSPITTAIACHGDYNHSYCSGGERDAAGIAHVGSVRKEHRCIHSVDGPEPSCRNVGILKL